ncbi:MAG TPA: adenylate/guanylate cyclase domain-containing protein [Anaerolineaceae bacterium]|nr:adenylate/guanylate cyclase domain-containing protein [Anaerolineaceae bacterium]
MSKSIPEQIADLKGAVAAQEGLRPMLGDAVVDATLSVLQQKLAELQSLVPRAEQQRKLVTILFSDVKGSTAMAEKIDPEQWAEIMNQAFEYLINPVNRHGGMIARLMGDAILAFFGAQAVHENDPEQAVLAGLEIVEGARSLREKISRQYGLEFGVRVGINSGPVLLGQVGTEIASEFTAMGDAINLAARMEQNAPVNGVLIAHDTYRMVRGLFEVTPQPPLEVRGKAEPVQTYVVARALPREERTSARGLEGVQTRLVGREDELAQMQAALRACLQDRRPTWVTVTGEAGMGKSRLTHEFLAYCYGEDAQHLQHNHKNLQLFQASPSEEMGAVAFSTLRDLFRRRFEILDGDPSALAQDKFEAGMIAYLDHDQAHLVGHWIGFDFSHTQAVKNLLGSAAFGNTARLHLTRYFRGLAGDFPLLLVLDDLHWADEASLSYFTSLVDELAGLPLFVLALARPNLDERLPGWDAALAAPDDCKGDRPVALTNEKIHLRIPLAPINRQDSLALVGEILQQAGPLPPSLSALILFQAGGNPYYIEEIIKMLIEEKVIRPGEPDWAAAAGIALPSIRVPRSLEGVIQARLDALSGEEKQTLQRASVFPQQFWDQAVQLLDPDHPDREVLKALDLLVQRGLIHPSTPSSFDHTHEFVFKHHLLRKATYETVLLKLRKQYHAQAAAWLEAHAGERLAEYQGKIADHYERAGCNEKAAEYLLQMGVAAYEKSAYPETMAAMEHALRLIPAEEEERRVAPTFWLGAAQAITGHFVESRRSQSWAFEAGQGYPAQRTYAAQAALCLSWVLGCQGQKDEQRRYIEAGYALAEQLGDPLILARARTDRLNFLDLTPQQYRAEIYASLREFEALGLKSYIAITWLNIGIFEYIQRNDPASVAAYQKGLEIYRQMGHRWGEANCYGNIGLVLKRQGDLQGALQHQEEYRRIALELGDQEGVAISASNLGNITLRLGRPQQALAYFQEGMKVALREEMLLILFGLLGGLALWHLNAGRAERAAEILGAIGAHPALDEETKNDLEDTINEVRPALSPEALQAALARGQARNFDAMVRDEGFLYGGAHG